MSVSLMSLLGANVNLSAGNGGDEAGKVDLTSNGDAAFETVMAAFELGEISAEQLQQYFAGQGIPVQGLLEGGQTAEVQQALAQFVQAVDGQNLPPQAVTLLQEALPPEVLSAIEEAVASLPVEGKAAGFATELTPEDLELIASLPNRELTPQELSEIVQKTGLPPIVIFTVLQDTPAASPNLAVSMVEDMGGAETGANLRALGAAGEMAGKAQPSEVAANTNVAPTNGAQPPAAQLTQQQPASQLTQQQPASQAGVPTNQTPQLPEQAAAQAEAKVTSETKTMTPTQREALAQIAAVLQRVAEQKPVQAQERTPQHLQNGAAPAQTPTAVPQAGVADGEGVVDLAQQSLAGKTNEPQVAGKNAASLNAQVHAVQTQSATGGEAAPQPSAPSAPVEQASQPQLRAVQAGAEQQFSPRTPMDNPADQVAVKLRQAVSDGSIKMDIRLNPSELGRVQVNINTDAEGNSKVTVTAERRDALDLLQRDARVLERALNDAGLKTDGNALSFNLRGDGNDQQQAGKGQNENGQEGKFSLDGEEMDELEDKMNESEMALSYDAGKAYRMSLDWGVDISV